MLSAGGRHESKLCLDGTQDLDEMRGIDWLPEAVVENAPASVSEEPLLVVDSMPVVDLGAQESLVSAHETGHLEKGFRPELGIPGAESPDRVGERESVGEREPVHVAAHRWAGSLLEALVESEQVESPRLEQRRIDDHLSMGRHPLLRPG